MTAASTSRIDTVVVGAGPAGLAVGAALQARGREALLLEAGARLGERWEGHYDRLRLNTVRWLSGLPDQPIPRAAGRWVSRDAFVAYLRDYARDRRLAIELGTKVRAVVRVADGYCLHTDRGELRAGQVVIATGPCATPRLPEWPGLDSVGDRISHAARYRNAQPFVDLDVLVVGSGNSAADIALDLAEGGAARVRMAVRTPPQILPRTTLGLPTQALGVATRRLPPALTDPIFGRLRGWLLPPVAERGLPQPRASISQQFRASDVVPIIDNGFSAAVHRGAIEIVPAVEGFVRGDVLLAGGGRIAVDRIIAATGYDADLAPLVGALGVLDGSGRPLAHGPHTHPAAPHLYFIGFTNPLAGNLRQLAIDARAIAGAIARATTGRSDQPVSGMALAIACSSPLH
jgi:cation diffusion facilitator CzcD-associated flavoprotein CzcO